MPEIIIWINLGLTAVALVLLVVLLIRRPKTNVREFLLETRLDINESLNNSIDNLGKVISQTQKDNSDLLLKSINSFFQQGSDRDTKFAMETEQKLENIRKNLDSSLNGIRDTVEKSLARLQNENAKKLDEIRHMVDEKLQKTLEDRITQSFRLVSERLEEVYKGLGEMRNLADGVGDLKRVLSNVKTRGTLGEIQLGNILEQILAPEQYVTDFATKRGSNDRVEFAVKLPGPNENEPVYLPIDAKFPLEDYRRLLDAYESGDAVAVKQTQKELERVLLQEAKNISRKYIDVPRTTEFAIMFLPIEGLYAKAVELGVVERMQREHRINVAGPTTMAALLNSLHMGFRTLAIQKHSGEVWKILGRVKTEFEKFGSVLAETQKRISQANEQLDKLVGVRTRQIQRQLEQVTAIEDVESKVMLAADNVKGEED